MRLNNLAPHNGQRQEDLEGRTPVCGTEYSTFVHNRLIRRVAMMVGQRSRTSVLHTITCCGRTITLLVGKHSKALGTRSHFRWKNGKVSITDGPYAETKEQLGGFAVFEERDLNHAIQLMSKHPAVKGGPVEIRPVDDLSEMIRESERRRSKAKDN
jgi:hypothetical protein